MKLSRCGVARVAATVATLAGVAGAEERIPYRVECDGRVSLAVFNASNQLVRTLLTGAPRRAGSYAETWDGLDRYGHPLPAGHYTWKLLASEGLRAEFITQVGQNADPVWERATGNHTAPNAVAVDATGLYRAGAENEGAHWAVKTDLAGRHLWTNDRWAADPWVQKSVAVTLVGGRLFELMPNGHVYGYDATSGRVFTGGDCDPKPWNLRWYRFDPPAGVSDVERRKLNAAQSPRDLAGDTANGLLVAAFPQHNALAWFSAQDGHLVDTVTNIAELAGIAVARDSTVLAIAGGEVVTLTRDHKTPRTLIAATARHDPRCLCISPASGDIFVAGKQVMRFSSAGKLLATFGKPEGRGDGVYVPTDFRGITDIEADHEGGFVVTEGQHTPPRRTARFDTSGKLLREWYGAQHYGVIACPEPDDPRFVWTLANAPQPGLVRWEVDDAKKSWRVAEVYQDVFASNRFFRGDSSHGSMVPTVFLHAGRLYIYNGGMSSLRLALYDPAAKRVRPCNASGGADGHAVIWNDLNDDGLVADGEIEQLSRNVVGGYIDPADFSLRTTPFGTREQAGQQVRPARFTPGGTPVYCWAASAPVAPWKENGHAHQPLDYRCAPDGSWYGSISDKVSNPNEGWETHGAWYYNSCSAMDRLVKWSRDGQQLWSVGRHSPDSDHETGSTAMPRGLVGCTHGCVIWGDASDEETARPTVWTEDGLYVDELLRVPVDNLPKEAYGMFNANEYPTGHLHTDTKTGEVLFYALNSGGGSPIYRITGWDGWQSASGSVTLAAAATGVAQRDGIGLKGEYFNSGDCSGLPALTRIDKAVYFNWGKGGPDGAVTSETFSVRWSGSYEAATSEDTRFEIRGSFPWRDKGQPLWSRLWFGGERVFDSKAAVNSGNTTYDEQAASSMGTVRVKLRAGERMGLRLECGFRRGEAAIALSHDTPGRDRRAILPEFLHPDSGPRKGVELAVEKRPELIADFGFEESDGVLSRSRAGGEIFGRLTGNARRVPGKVGVGIELAPKGEFAPALFPVDEALRLPDTDYTVAFWFRTPAANIRLCAATRYSSYNNRWSDHVVELDQGLLRFALNGDEPLSTKRTFNDGDWHHVVTTVGFGGERLYVDGQLIATGKLTRRTHTSNRLGMDLGPGGGNGLLAIDELKILGRAITPQEVEAFGRCAQAE